MAILIVDDEASTRTALRDLLTQLGHKVILEAKNGEEALKTAEAEKSRIRMIVADWEMPYMDGITLLERIAGLPELDLAPFLLITSDLPRARLAELQAKTDRLDGFLIKPFRMKALSQAMHQAQAHRAATRRTLIAFESGSALSTLSESLVADQGVNWAPLYRAKSVPELQEAVKVQSRRLGALVIDPCQPVPGLPEWLAQFSRTHMGASIPIVCASREPALIFPFRTHCQFFVDSNADATVWTRTLAQIRGRVEGSLETELLFQENKVALQSKDFAESFRVIRRILELDPVNSEALSLLGSLLDSQGKRTEAVQHFQRALEANPCQPRPYIALLDILPNDSALRNSIAEQAVSFCPQNLDVLWAAAKSWKAAGNSTRAAEAARRILAVNPAHAEAKTLVDPS